MAFLASLIGPAISSIGSIVSSKNSKTNPLSGQIDNLPATSADLLKGLPGQRAAGTATAAQGAGNLGSAGEFFKTILGGGQADTEKLLGPNVNTILSQYDSALKSGGELGPRGGGRTNAIESAKTGKAGAYGNLLGSAQQTAAGGLAQVGQAQSAAGNQQTSQAFDALKTLLGTQSQAAKDAAAQWGNIGNSFGSSIAKLSGGGGGSGGSDGTDWSSMLAGGGAG